MALWETNKIKFRDKELQKTCWIVSEMDQLSKLKDILIIRCRIIGQNTSSTQASIQNLPSNFAAQNQNS